LREAIIDYSSSGACVDLVGTPEMVADQMDEAMQAVGGDGFLIALPNVSRKTVAEITDGLVPALQQRGLVRVAYEHQHFRDNLLAY
jgi:alkanesulfonate monooxygenase SsuD/methylene tetrahydromethanopterin reductase-like flavin-dependent oxidoreductase (luciferase family)